MRDQPVIQPMSPDLIESYHACLDEVARERKFLLFLEAPPLDVSRQFVQALLDRQAPMFVALDDGDVVGWCDIGPNPRPGFTHCGQLGIGIVEAWRGRGLGRQLLETTLAAARDYGLTRIELDVYASNTRAIRLYERFGFVREGLRRRARLLDFEYEDMVSMALLWD